MHWLISRRRVAAAVCVVLWAATAVHADPNSLVVSTAEAPARVWAPFSTHQRLRPDLEEVPLEEIAGPHRERVLQILRRPVAAYRGPREMFPCHPELLEWLIRHPVAVGDYWKQMGMTLAEVDAAPGGFVCRDDFGAVVHFFPVLEKPNLRVVYCVGESPAGVLPVKMRAEMVVVHRYRFEQYDGAGDYVVQQLDGYASASGVTLKMAMKFAPVQAEHMVETCVQEIKVFFSVMSRLMQLRPQWSLEKLPAVAQKLSEPEAEELERLLRSLPAGRRPAPEVRRLEAPVVGEVASDPSGDLFE